MMTSTIRAVVLVDVDTAISTIIEATQIVGFIIADPISNQCDVSSTICMSNHRENRSVENGFESSVQGELE